MNGRVAVGLLLLQIAGCASHAPETAVPGASAKQPTASAECARRMPEQCGGSPPTYERQVRPILAQRCFACHAGSGSAVEEHDFSRFEVASAQRGRIAEAVAACAMPPRGAGRLPDAQAEVLLRWVACGARER